MAVDFASSINWTALYDSLTIGAAGIQIAPITLSSSLNFRFLRVAANNQNARSSWKLGGYCFLMVDEPNPEVIVERIFTSVNKPSIIAVPDYLASYRVVFSPPKWFDEISLQIDGYTGTL